MNERLTVFLFLLCVFCSSCAQIFLKLGAKKQYKGIKAYLNRYVIIGYGIFFAMTLCSTYLYRYISIVLGTILDSFSYVFVAALSVLFFKENWNWKKTFGMFFIILGTLFVL